MTTKLNVSHGTQNRNGTVAVLFAITLPVLLLICAMAINLAQMQLTRTELKIATDTAARSGGRAWSRFHDVDIAKDFARRGAALNTVGGQPLLLSTVESDGQIIFGNSNQVGDARFDFASLTDAEVLEGALPTGVQVNATQSSSLFFQIGTTSSFIPSATSVASQIDRDIGLVLDRSGSMAYFAGQDTDPGAGEDFLFNTITDLYNDAANGITTEDYENAVADYQAVPDLAALSLSQRQYSANILNLLSGDLRTYAETVNSNYRTGITGPTNSSWDLLRQGNMAFFNVLKQPTREILVSVCSFSSGAELNVSLTSDLDEAEAAIDSMFPTGSTAIGDGMLEAYYELKSSSIARRSALKTLVVFTDGVSNNGTSPSAAASEIIEDNPRVVIHTITFGANADVVGMQAVSNAANGKHYHAVNGGQLVEIFEEIANDFKTVITQ